MTLIQCEEKILEVDQNLLLKFSNLAKILYEEFGNEFIIHLEDIYSCKSVSNLISIISEVNVDLLIPLRSFEYSSEIKVYKFLKDYLTSLPFYELVELTSLMNYLDIDLTYILLYIISLRINEANAVNLESDLLDYLFSLFLDADQSYKVLSKFELKDKFRHLWDLESAIGKGITKDYYLRFGKGYKLIDQLNLKILIKAAEVRDPISLYLYEMSLKDLHEVRKFFNDFDADFILTYIHDAFLSGDIELIRRLMKLAGEGLAWFTYFAIPYDGYDEMDLAITLLSCSEGGNEGTNEIIKWVISVINEKFPVNGMVELFTSLKNKK